ncbi:MAG: 5'/3'-nucleotidase SurE [Pseudomonadota bacterium]
MRILVTNDDGIHAPGLKVLETIAKALSDEVWIVAPETEQSGAGHSLTLTEPIRFRHIDKRRFAVRGTPTDCVMMAVHHILPENGGDRPDLVLSGVNRGGNLGEDVTYSGTVAATIEGTLSGIKSIALSQSMNYKEGRANWSAAEAHADALIKKLISSPWPEEVLMNVNFPALSAEDVRGIQVTTQGRRDLTKLDVVKHVDPRGFPYYWFKHDRSIGDPDQHTDLRAIEDGFISVSPLQLDFTHEEARNRLKADLEVLF